MRAVCGLTIALVAVCASGADCFPLTSKETNWAGGYGPGTLIHNTTKTISKDQIQWLRDRIERAGLRKLRTYLNPENGAAHLDGAQWIAEASKGGIQS